MNASLMWDAQEGCSCVTALLAFGPYSPANSPIALPDRPILCSANEVVTLFNSDDVPDFTTKLDGKALTSYLAGYGTENDSLDAVLGAQGVAPMAQRRPILLLGELANPYRLQDINIGPLPVFPVRIEDVCRTWADGLDTREAYPGVHHVTLARTPRLVGAFSSRDGNG